MHNSRPTMELHDSTHEALGVILPETTLPTPAVEDLSIDIRISSSAGMKIITKGTVPPEPRRQGPGKTLEPIHVLLMVRDETHNRTDSIKPCGLVRPTIQYFDPAAKNPAHLLSPMSSDSRERMINLALTQSDLPQRKIQSMHYPTSAR